MTLQPLRMGGLAATTESWFQDEVVDLGDALALRSPSDPTFRWGNLLILPEPPVPGSRSSWEARFREAFADVGGVRHMTFAWSGEDGAAGEFEAAGYEPDRNVVRIGGIDDLQPAPPIPEGFSLRIAETQGDWEQLRAFDLADPPMIESFEAYAQHREARWKVYKSIGLGEKPGLRGGYFLATVDGIVAGSVGLYVKGGLGRFQYVHVSPDFRRRGVATSMMHAVSRVGFERFGADRLLIMADEGEAPDRVYARLGFPVVERYVGVCLREPGS